ncbi:hypothetical protein COY90_05355 [Candidatus Roizmanbacteria bacterium CG_4_10_14_0_8_um_filter_39_9]|uniref:ABC transporter permease n=1 Tax=Candidatus Roizmanbacteria bacterium CG_4_10_14_0_8_um_filter_39_9 TaxID=1974829 RepID=A0A2M7QC98_9BACT|nr:MAG: hypothetical protein COY90_05355 [Candidatus Roizmanbacteria bacterium CG_4_10_14_0_8_um_filter_39_9]
MNTLVKQFRLFTLFSRFALRTTLQARMGIVFFMLGKIFRFVFIFALLAFIFSKTKTLKGYSFEQTAVFFLTYNIIDSVSQVLFREVYRFRYMVVSGTFDMVLLKPFHPFIKVLVGGVDLLDLVLVIPYIILLIIAAFHISAITFGSVLLYILLIINSLLFASAFHICVLSMGLIFTEVDHAIMIYRDVTGLARMPMDIYKEPVRSFFTFVIPVGLMMSIPVKAFMNILVWPVIFYAFFSSWVLLWGSIVFWKRALKKYQSWGG